MADSNEFQEIMREITNGMTGNKKHDRKYLNEMAEQYQDHPLGERILKEISRLMYSVLSEEEQTQLNASLKQEGIQLHLAVQAAMYHIQNKKYLQAREVLAKELKRHEKLYPYKNTDTVEYYCFDEPFDRVMHGYYAKSDKACEGIEVPFTMAYYVYALVMEDLNQMDAARKALDKALHWNPYSAAILLKRTEIISKSLDEIALLEGTKTALLYAYKPALVAECYANFGKYYTKQEKYALAIGCYMMCQEFDENNKDAMQGLKKLYEITKGTVSPPSFEEVKRLAEEEDLPLGPNRDIVGLAFAYGKKYYEDANYEAAKYFLQIGYDLTGDEDVEKILQEIAHREKKD